MIQCGKCGFSVNELMKFALMQNKCPSCGGELFSADDMEVISVIQSKVSSERFASKLTSELLYDVSLFIFNEINGDLAMYMNKRNAHKNKEIVHQEVDPDDEEYKLRKEIESEYHEELSTLDEDDEDMDPDISLKAEKLKKLRERQVINNPNLGKIPVTAKDRKPGTSKINRVT